jgi:hypothetical protein
MRPQLQASNRHSFALFVRALSTASPRSTYVQQHSPAIRLGSKQECIHSLLHGSGQAIHQSTAEVFFDLQWQNVQAVPPGRRQRAQCGARGILRPRRPSSCRDFARVQASAHASTRAELPHLQPSAHGIPERCGFERGGTRRSGLPSGTPAMPRLERAPVQPESGLPTEAALPGCAGSALWLQRTFDLIVMSPATHALARLFSSRPGDPPQ